MDWRASLQTAWWRPRGSAAGRGAGAGTNRLGPWALLLPLAALYGLLWRLHRWSYRSGWRRAQRAPVPVIVVGNLIVGGAGKTPTTIALVQALQQRGWTPGVVSRGFAATNSADSDGRSDNATRSATHHATHNAAHEVNATSSAAAVGDEPLLIRRRTGVPVWVARRRIDAANALCAAHPEVNMLVSDDGLQHLALHRDAQLIVFDDRGIGNQHLLPAGPLREPFTAAPPARSIVLYNTAAPSTAWPGDCAQRGLAGAVRLSDWWAGVPAMPAGLDALRGGPGALLAAAGIAAPERFFAMLEAAGLRIERLPLPDHAGLDPRPWPASAERIIVTEKDAVKIAPDAADAARIHVATLDFRIPDATVDALMLMLPPRAPRPIDDSHHASPDHPTR